MDVVHGPNNLEPHFVIDFIDPVFAVVFHIGLAEGLMTEDWFKNWQLPSGDAAFNFWVFLLGILTVLLSWVGYHNSIRTKRIRGYGRFIFDVIIVLLYAVVLVQYKNLGAVLFVLAAIFVFFFVWDLFKIGEYRDEFRTQKAGGVSFLKRYERQRITFVWMVLFIFFSLAHHLAWLGQITLLSLAYGATILYRVDKAYNFLGNLIGELKRVLVGRGEEIK